MTPKTAAQVLIAGAGPTGLILACDLARRGVAFRIIDAAPRFPIGSRGKALQPRSLEVLDDLGVVDEILSSGRFHMTFRGYDGSTVLGEWDWHEGRDPTPIAPYASTLMIPQWRVEGILRDRLAALGGSIALATTLTGFTQDAEGVTATVSRDGVPEQMRVSYLVGCDGGQSFVRRELGVAFEGETCESHRMLVGDVEADGLGRDHWHVWPKAADGALALCPLPGTNCFQFQAMLNSSAALEPSLRNFQEILDQRTGRSDIRLHNASWLSLYRANVRMVNRYRAGRIFLAGDAAHVHSPAGGQGMNTGIQDAYNLAWKLGQALAGAPDELLDTYEEERLPIAARMLGVTSKRHRQGIQGHATESRNPETLQLQINYRGRSLARDVGNSLGTVKAGDRAPDAPCRRASGAAMRLFDAFRGSHFTLLAFGAAHADVVAQVNLRCRPFVHAYAVVRPGQARGGDSIVDSDGHVRTGYGVERDALVLVRPDGYVGVFARPGNLQDIVDYLRLKPGAAADRCSTE